MTQYDHIEKFTGRYLTGGLWFGRGRTWDDWKAVDPAAVQVAGLDVSRFDGGLTGLQKWLFELLRPCGDIKTWHVIDARSWKPMIRVGFGSSLDADRAIAKSNTSYSSGRGRITITRAMYGWKSSWIAIDPTLVAEFRATRLRNRAARTLPNFLVQLGIQKQIQTDLTLPSAPPVNLLPFSTFPLASAPPLGDEGSVPSNRSPSMPLNFGPIPSTLNAPSQASLTANPPSRALIRPTLSVNHQLQWKGKWWSWDEQDSSDLASRVRSSNQQDRAGEQQYQGALDYDGLLGLKIESDTVARLMTLRTASWNQEFQWLTELPEVSGVQRILVQLPISMVDSILWIKPIHATDFDFGPAGSQTIAALGRRMMDLRRGEMRWSHERWVRTRTVNPEKRYRAPRLAKARWGPGYIHCDIEPELS